MPLNLSKACALGVAASLLLTSMAPAQGAGAPPQFKTLALCLAALKSEEELATAANAKLSSASFNTGAEREAMAEQNKHNRNASEIRKVCETMRLAEEGLTPARRTQLPRTGGSGDDVRELAGLLQGSVVAQPGTAAVTRGVQMANMSRVHSALASTGDELDQALAEFRAADFASGARPRSLTAASPPSTQPFGAAAAESFRSDMAIWKREEAERQRLAALEAERLRQIAAQRAAEARQRQAALEAEQERKAQASSGVMDTLFAVATGVMLGKAAASGNAGALAYMQAMQPSYGSTVAAGTGAPLSSAGGDGGLESQCPGLLSRIEAESRTQPSSGGICSNVDVLVASLRRSESLLRSCPHPHAREALAGIKGRVNDALATKASTCGG